MDGSMLVMQNLNAGMACMRNKTMSDGRGANGWQHADYARLERMNGWHEG